MDGTGGESKVLQEVLADLKTPCTIFFCHKEKELNENDTFDRNWLYVIYDVCGDEISIIKLFIMLMYINSRGNQLLKSVKSSAKFPLQLAMLYYAS